MNFRSIFQKNERFFTKMQRPDILFVINSPRIGGAESVALSDAIEIRKVGIQSAFFFVTRGNNSAKLRFTEAGFEVYTGTSTGRAYDPSEPIKCAKALKTIIRQANPHIVHAHDIEADIVARLALTGMAEPHLITTYHGSPLLDIAKWPVPFVKKHLLRYAVKKRSAECMAVSQKLAKRMEQVLGPEVGIDIFYNSRSASHFCPCADKRDEIRHEHGVSDEETIFVCVANFHPYKNQALLLRALAGISQMRRCWRLWLVGRGDQTALEGLAVKLRISARVHFFTNISDPAMILRGADAFVLPSNIEGFPLVIIEAMLTGLPVIATAVCGVPEIVDHNKTGFLIEPGNEHALRKELIRVLEMTHSERVAFGAEGLKNAKEKFSNEARISKLTNMYLRQIEG